MVYVKTKQRYLLHMDIKYGKKHYLETVTILLGDSDYIHKRLKKCSRKYMNYRRIGKRAYCEKRKILNLCTPPNTVSKQTHRRLQTAMFTFRLRN